ncbi:MAG: CHAT domain-containing tetratricopeptide repeat protein, partial [Bacteroidota bacterium]
MHALTYFQRAKDINLAHYGENSSEVADDLLNLGAIHEDIGQYKKAIAYFEQTLDIIIPLFGEDHLRAAEVYGNLGICYENRKFYDLAIKFYKHELRIYKKFFGENYFDNARSYVNIASCLTSKGELNEAKRFCEKALKIRMLKLGKNHYKVAAVLNQLGEIHLMTNKLNEAYDFFIKAIKVLNFEHSSEFTLTKVSDELELLQGLTNLSKSCRQMYKVSGELTMLEEAMIYDSLSLDLIDRLIEDYRTSSSKQILFENSYVFFEIAILNVLDYYEEIRNSELLELAWKYMEKSKAILLKESLQNIDIEEIIEVPDSILQIEIDIQERLDHLNAADTLSITERNYLLENKRKYEAFKSFVKMNYPLYHQFRFKGATKGLKEFQSSILDKDQTFIEFFFGNSNLIVATVDKDSFSFHRFELSEVMLSAINNFNSLIINFPISKKDNSLFDKEFLETGYYLFSHLIEPFEKRLRERVIIAPDGPFWKLPFEALITKSSVIKDSNSKTYPYWLNEAIISYTYSASLLSETSIASLSRGNGELLGVAPLFLDKDLKINDITRSAGPLMFNQKEVMNILEMIPGKPLIGKNADKEAFLDAASNYSFIHLATHAQSDSTEGRNSFLLFYSGKDSFRQSPMYVKEIYNLKLEADMVVLSACETGVGEMKRGEGVISLARAFLYAGASSVVTSLWKVNDKQTAILLESFYDFLSKGNPKDKALALAKRKYIQDSRMRATNPYYWAGFIPIGNMNVVEVKSVES